MADFGGFLLPPLDLVVPMDSPFGHKLKSRNSDRFYETEGGFSPPNKNLLNFNYSKSAKPIFVIFAQNVPLLA